MRDEFSRIQFVSRVVKKGVSQGGTNSSKSVMRLGLGTPNMNISNPLSLFFYRGHPTYVEEKILIIFTLKWYLMRCYWNPDQVLFYRAWNFDRSQRGTKA